MCKLYRNLRSGERIKIPVVFVTRRGVDAGGERILRLVFEDKTGTQFPVLITPDRDGLWDVKTGESYWINGLLGVEPPQSNTEVDGDCPDCGGDMRPRQLIDALDPAIGDAVETLGIDGRFGIIDDTTDVMSEVDRTVEVDDWRSMEDTSSEPVSDYVCEYCDRIIPKQQVGPSDGTAPHAHECAPAASSNVATTESVGLATGGAKDADNFRENIRNGYTPQPQAITDEGLFYDYHFDTGDGVESDALFAPRYATAVSNHPLEDDQEYYLSVGLDSTVSIEDFERPSLDIVVVLDISGSMNSSFDSYYYNEQGQRQSGGDDDTSKLDAAKQSLCALTRELRDDDRLGVVLFNGSAHVAKPLRGVDVTDMEAVRSHIHQITAGGGTNLEAGFETARELCTNVQERDGERRVIFMTDMMPNTGATAESDLSQQFADAAVESIHTTFMGIGLDANAELIETLSGIRGANHYFIHSADDFEVRLAEEFDYMVTPLVYDLTLELESEGYEVEAIHGSPTIESTRNQLMHVGTLFPSAKEEGDTRGGVVLARLNRIEGDSDLELVATWTERNGGTHSERVSVTMPEASVSFEHDGVRKAVALARYARELRSWVRSIHESDSDSGTDDWVPREQRGKHERQSVPLSVPEEFVTRFADIQSYLEKEMEVLGDETLQQELDLLEKLVMKSSAENTLRN